MIAALRGPLAFAKKAPSRLVGLVDLVAHAAASDPALQKRLVAIARTYDARDDDGKRAVIAEIERTLTEPPPTRLPVRPPSGEALATPLQFLKGIGPKKAIELAERGLHTIADALALMPRTYEDRRTVARIADLTAGTVAVVTGTVVACGAGGFGRGRRYEVALDDGTGTVRLAYFHFRLAEMHKRFVRGARVTAIGEVQVFGGRKQIVHPRTITSDDAVAKQGLLGGVHPVYSELQGMHPLQVARVVQAAYARAKELGVPDAIPASLRARAGVVSYAEALEELHAPKDTLTADAFQALANRRSAAHKRLAFEELLVLALAIEEKRRMSAQDSAPALAADVQAEAARMLPFALTSAQARAIKEIDLDLASGVPMARLLQGDVGAGKTAVAAAACLRAVRSGAQAAFMAPTELLAEQHGRTLVKLFTPLGVRVEIITGSKTKKARALAEARLKNRDIDVVVGTQALLTESVSFKRLGLCVIDEQHRFGVVQRAALKAKGADGQVPHLLVMTATPIPRSLALTVYGDLSVSVLDELPPGRTPVATRVTSRMEHAVRALHETLARGERAFCVYPLIEESEKLAAAAAVAGFEEFTKVFGADTALLHGKMSAKEREDTMAKFARGEVRVLVSTTVIEVGVDVPEATLMIVMDAERFGLAQIHQLRGRVGRSARPSRCVLVVGNAAGEDAQKRLAVLEATNDGFKIADEDLAQRGPGDVLGTRQSGLPSLAFSDLVTHAPLIELTRVIARELLDADRTLAREEHRELARLVRERYAARLALAAAG